MDFRKWLPLSRKNGRGPPEDAVGAPKFQSNRPPESVLMICPNTAVLGGLVIRTFLSGLTAAALLAAPLSDAVAAACYTQAEATAVQVRMLQSELMVGALACRDSNPELGMIGQYNEFVRRVSDRLVSHSKILQARFQKTFGAEGHRRLEAFVTALANDASKRSMTAGYCQNAAGLFSQVSSLDRRELERFSAARAMAVGMPVSICAAHAATE
jgi:hypothetical protein